MTPRSQDTGAIEHLGTAVGYERNPAASCAITSYKSISYVVNRERKSFSGYDIDNFHARKARGELLPHTPFTKRTYSLQVTPSATMQEIVKSSGCATNEWTPCPFFLGTYDSFDRSVGEDVGATGVDPVYLVQMAAAAIYGKGWDLGTFLGELGQTLRMFTSLANRMLRHGDEWHNLDARDFENLWLENRYGWRTFVYDVQDLYGALTKFDRNRKRYSERQGVSSDWVESVGDQPYLTAALRVSRDTTTEIGVSLRGSVTADIQPPQFSLNPFVTGWELLRFSFIFDWIVGVGQWLQALSFLFFSSAYTASYGYRVKRIVTVTTTGSDGLNPSTHTYTYGGATAVSNLEEVVRVPASVSTFPLIRKLPGIDAAKIADLITILRKLANIGR